MHDPHRLRIRHRPRHGGRSKYGLRVMLFRPLFDTPKIVWRLRRAQPLTPIQDSRRKIKDRSVCTVSILNLPS
jgi:hypothetical protein